MNIRNLIIYWSIVISVIVGSTLLLDKYAHANDIAIYTIVAEGRNQSLEGQIAIANVIRNRVAQKRWYGRTVEEVCKKPWQFSCWNNKKDRNYPYNIKITNNIWNNAKKAWDLSANTNLVDNANLYHTTKVKPSWNKSKKVKFIKKIDDHLFYYESV